MGSMNVPVGAVPVAPPTMPFAVRPPMGGSFAVPVLSGPPKLPQSARLPLTEGIPDPSAVQKQKESYARSLEEQLRKGVEVLAQTHKQQTEALHAQANQEKQRYNTLLDQQVKT